MGATTVIIAGARLGASDSVSVPRGISRLPSLDGIRAISIALVILAHLVGSGPIWQYGGFGVNIFFVLSGFLITWLLCREESARGRISLKSFYWRRLFRILPPVLAYLAVVSIIFGPKKSDILNCLLFVRNLSHGPIYTTHFWSLSIEEQFYLLWPAMFFLLGKNERRLIFALFSLSLVPIWIHVSFKMGLVSEFARFDLRCDAIIAGCCLALLRNDRKFAEVMRSPWLCSGWVIAIAVASIGYTAGAHAPVAVAGVLSSVAVAVVINAVVSRGGGFLNHPAVVWIGKLSYSLYIWQQLFCCAPQVGWFGQFPQNLVATTFAAALSYYFVEQPAFSLRDWLSRILRSSRLQPLGPAPSGADSR